MTATLKSVAVRQVPAARPARLARTLRVGANLAGAAGAALFLRAGLEHFLTTHSVIGAGFVAAQLWVVIAFLARRAPSAVTTRARDWLLAVGGSFGGVLLRPSGLHLTVGVTVGALLQGAGLLLSAAAFVALGRSFGFSAADRRLKTSGPYRVVRHPLYAAYVLLELGYLAQSLSLSNAAVVAVVISCDIGRALAEERLLEESSSYDGYRARVPWRLVPGLW
ncbi:MAG TPA: methyltransferase [Acidimicrobiales bacterium]|nr:methyltransferase [Acidimicrobiales bacterium]